MIYYYRRYEATTKGAIIAFIVSCIITGLVQVRGYVADPAQLRAVDELERCAAQWQTYKEKRSNPLKKLVNRPEIPRGVYMYGGVGRGKSFLMDCFFSVVPLRRKVFRLVVE